MISAVDTNILSDIVNESEAYTGLAIAALRNAHHAGVLVICDIVYAELATVFATMEQCDSFLHRFRIKVECIETGSSFAASRSWLSYLKTGGKRTRILPDFLIAAHAFSQADRLISRDRGFYRTHFPKLKLVDPTRP